MPPSVVHSSPSLANDRFSGDRWTVWALLVISGSALLAYHNSFGVPFLFDDDSSIKDNPTIRSLLLAWQPPSGGLTVTGRPLLNFTLALNYAVSGTAVWSYHVLNLLIHVAAGGVLFGIVRRTLGGSGLVARFGRDATLLALGVALVWTLHPLQTESVTYVVQRAESLVSLCYLLTLWCFIRAIEPGASKVWAPLAIVVCAVGMAAKEVMVTAPVMVALYDRVFVAGSWSVVWTKRVRFHFALATTWLLLAALVIGTAGRGGTAGFGTSVTAWMYALTQAEAVVHYLRLAVWPSPLVFDYGKGLVEGMSDVWWQFVLLGGLLTGSLVALWRGRVAGYCGLFFFVVLAPSSSVVPVVTQTMAEHRTYLALAGLVSFFVVGGYAVIGRRSLFVIGGIALVFAGLTARRNQDYRDEINLWEDTAAKYPHNARAFATLGTIHQRENHFEQALAALQSAQRITPSFEISNNLGNVWMKLGRWTEASQAFEEALRLKPDQALVLNNLGNARLQEGRTVDAIHDFEAALRLAPELHSARYNLANTLAQSGRLADAAPHYAQYLGSQPNDAEARSNYSSVLQALDRPREAIAQLEVAAQLLPGSAAIHNNLGVALAQAGRVAEALPHFQTAVRLDPHYREAQENADRAARALARQ